MDSRAPVRRGGNRGGLLIFPDCCPRLGVVGVEVAVLARPHNTNRVLSDDALLDLRNGTGEDLRLDLTSPAAQSDVFPSVPALRRASVTDQSSRNRLRIGLTRFLGWVCQCCPRLA